MAINDNKDRYFQLRKQYPVFTYKHYNYTLEKDCLFISFEFELSGKHCFRPTLSFDLSHLKYKLPSKEAMNNLVFHLGMIELISYWKLSCSPQLMVKPFHLSNGQIAFWKKLYFHGLGEFFYINSIAAKQTDFMTIQSSSQNNLISYNCNPDSVNVLVPVGGGKDSNVSLSLLKSNFNVTPFIINPRGASRESAIVTGFSENEIFKVNRKLDPLLLQLNDQGFLNGHTPFSALLAFVSILAATLTGAKYIALSNESSANEPTVKDGPNHQYSKSYEFEKDFRKYVQSNITGQIEYFSFLRPLSELQIAHLFSKTPHFFPVFKSCNVGSKTDSWCGKCPKCLFTYIILSPFISDSILNQIVGKPLFEDKNLLPVLDELTGISDIKPFECVGTIDEVNLAMSLAVEVHSPKLPYLLRYFKDSGKMMNQPSRILEKHLHEMDENHFIPSQFLAILKQHLHVS